MVLLSIKPQGLYTYKDKFDLFIGDNCDACNGMDRKAEEFACKHHMVYKTYSNSKEIPHIPAIRYCEFTIIGNRAFEKLLFVVKAKRENLI